MKKSEKRKEKREKMSKKREDKKNNREENRKKENKKEKSDNAPFCSTKPIGTTMSYSVSSHFSLETHQVDITKRFFEAAFDIAVVLISLSK